MASFSGAQKAALASQSISSSTKELYPVISGIWTSSFALGNFLGPSVGGFLFDLIDFRHTTLVFQCVALALLVLDLYKISRMRRRSKKSGKAKLVLKKVRGADKVDLYERL